MPKHKIKNILSELDDALTSLNQRAFFRGNVMSIVSPTYNTARDKSSAIKARNAFYTAIRKITDILEKTDRTIYSLNTFAKTKFICASCGVEKEGDLMSSGTRGFHCLDCHQRLLYYEDFVMISHVEEIKRALISDIQELTWENRFHNNWYTDAVCAFDFHALRTRRTRGSDDAFWPFGGERRSYEEAFCFYISKFDNLERTLKEVDTDLTVIDTQWSKFENSL